MKTKKRQRNAARKSGLQQPAKGRRFTAEEQAEALGLIASGLKRGEVARVNRILVFG
jgi:hypothetical protein